MNALVIIYYQNDPRLPTKSLPHFKCCCRWGILLFGYFKISYDSLFLAYSCWVLNQFFYFQGFRGRRFSEVHFQCTLSKTRVPQSKVQCARVHDEDGSSRPQRSNSSRCPTPPPTRSATSVFMILVHGRGGSPQCHDIPGLKHVAYYLCHLLTSSSWTYTHTCRKEKWTQTKNAAKR